MFLFSAIVGVVSTLAGGGRIHEGSKTDCKDYSSSMMDGIGTEARFNYPWGIEFDPGENVLYVADCVSFFVAYIVLKCCLFEVHVISLRYLQVMESLDSHGNQD